MRTVPRIVPLGILACLSLMLLGSPVAAIEIQVSGAKAGFPIAIPRLCDQGDAAEASIRLADVMTKDLSLTGLFKILEPGTFVESPGKCRNVSNVAYSDWSVIGAEGLVRGEVGESSRGNFTITLYLYDVLQQRAVVGKQYAAAERDLDKVAHRFANEIVRFFTRIPGVFDTRIAYVSRVGRFKELFVMDMNGENVRQLTRDKGLAISPSWSPSSDGLVYTSYRTRQPELYSLQLAGGAPRQLTRQEGMELGARYAPDGRSIVASASRKGRTNLIEYDLSGKEIRKLTQGPWIDVSPDFSPDGSKIVFTSNRRGGPQIYVMSRDGGRPERVSFADSNYCTDPSWSPDGSQLVFVCRQSGNQLFVSRPDGKDVRQLTFRGNNEDPAWSPDGRFVAFSTTAGKGARNIALLSLVSGKTTQLTFAQSENGQPAWSAK